MAQAHAGDFRVEVVLRVPSMRPVKYTLERREKECSERTILCDTIFSHAEKLNPDIFLSDHFSPHASYYDISYKTPAKAWMRRIYVFEPGVSRNAPVRELAKILMSGKLKAGKE